MDYITALINVYFILDSFTLWKTTQIDYKIIIFTLYFLRIND